MKTYVVMGVAALACSTSAWAQSSVTVFGFIEAQVGRQTQQAPGTKLFDMGGSRLGFKGDEDLGGGMKASFYLEHRLNPDDGTVGGGDTFWKGGSWVGLSSDTMGSVKVGRWWSQSFLKSQYAADPFGMGTLGEGTYGSVGCGPAFRGGCLGAFWLNNAVSYENSIGGFGFGAQVSVESPVAGGERPANVGVSYADGPLYVGAGYEVSNDGSEEQNWASVAANYDFGAVKLYGGYGSGRDAAEVSRKNVLVGFSAPVGSGAVIASYNLQDQDGVRVQQLASLGYKHFLSKRTNVFAVVANDSKAPAGTNKTGYALGLFHSF
ncbi:porin [Piscinibacter sp.]|uniref:porin n=1 Tax=Piscinibacter sp. TaxID=1903157 RepID=UPI002BB6A7A4|nr:porin [Albitalea sp.]HUG20926.1 porin [Albitalea sp.]